MSYQIKNTLILHQKAFRILKTTNDGLITPEDFGIETKYRSSILMSGYLTSYKIDADSNLILKDFYVNVHMNDDLKFINGIPPHISSKTDIESKSTFREYRNLNLKVEYSGYILLGYSTIRKPSIKFKLCGSEYEEVYELQVTMGKVVSINNVSDKMMEYRTKVEQEEFTSDSKNIIVDKDMKKWLFKDIQF